MAWLYQRNDSAVWWIGWRTGGRQYLKSTGKTEKQEAEKVLAQYRSMHHAKIAGSLTEDFYRALTGATLPRLTLQKALKDWLDECAGLAEKTVLKYSALATEFAAYQNTTPDAPLVRDITVEDVRGFLNSRRGQLSVGTIKLNRKLLSVFFRRLSNAGTIAKNPVAAVKVKGGNSGDDNKRRAFTLEELGLIYDKAPSDFWRYMILAGFYCGQRMGDLITIRWGSVDLKENTLHITPRKTRNSSGITLHIPMAGRLRQLLYQLRAKAGGVNPTDPVWPEQSKAYLSKGAGPFSNDFYASVLAPAGLVVARESNKKAKKGRAHKRDASPVSFHSLRHTFVSLLKATGGNQAVAKELAGHSSDIVSDLYTHLPREALALAIGNLPEVG